MKYFYLLFTVLILTSNPGYSQDPQKVVAWIHGDEKGSLFGLQYLDRGRLLQLWSRSGLHGHKVYVNLDHNGVLEWRVSGWKSSFDGGFAHGAVNKEGLEIFNQLASKYILYLESVDSEKKLAFFMERPPKGTPYEYFADKGIDLYEVDGEKLRKLNEKNVTYTINWKGPRIKQ